VGHEAALRTLSIEVELAPGSDVAREVAGLAVALRDSLGLTVPVHAVAPGTLPRFEMKARRFIVRPDGSA
jgi:phenylacetate-CoA ligase